MTSTTFAAFTADAVARGYDEVLERVWAAGQVVEEHRHPFVADALVVAGDLWLTEAGHTRHLTAGDRFHLERDAPHAERYGDEGAVYWVARRSPK